MQLTELGLTTQHQYGAAPSSDPKASSGQVMISGKGSPIGQELRRWRQIEDGGCAAVGDEADSAEHRLLRLLPSRTSHLSPQCAAAATLMLLPHAGLLQVDGTRGQAA